MKIISLSVVLVSVATVVCVGVTYSTPYDPWYDFNHNGEIDIFDIVDIAGRYGTIGVPINTTELLLNLHARVVALNATVIALQNRVSLLEDQATRTMCAETHVHYTTQLWTPPPFSIDANDIKVDFPVTFTNVSNIELSVSGVVTSGSGAGYPFRITGIQIETTYAILTLQGWNGASWVDLGSGDEVDISYVAVEKKY